MALLQHFSESQGDMSKPLMHEAYTVTFVEEPNSFSLDFCEDMWYHKLNAQINIQNMCFCLRQSVCFHHARRDLVATTTKMHVD